MSGLEKPKREQLNFGHLRLKIFLETLYLLRRAGLCAYLEKEWLALILDSKPRPQASYPGVSWQLALPGFVRCLQKLVLISMESRDFFFAYRKNLWDAESCLLKVLKAFLDLGRHMLQRGLRSE